MRRPHTIPYPIPFSLITACDAHSIPIPFSPSGVALRSNLSRPALLLQAGTAFFFFSCPPPHYLPSSSSPPPLLLLRRFPQLPPRHILTCCKSQRAVAAVTVDRMIGLDGPALHLMIRIPKFKVVLPVKTYMYEYNLLQRWAGKRTLSTPIPSK